MPPKISNSIRTIQVPLNIIKRLKNYKKDQLEHILYMGEAYNNKNSIFCDKLGNPIEDKRPGRNLKSILTKINIEPIKFHALRHTYVTRLFEAGVPPKTIQHLMGYANIKTTMNIYTHVMEEQKLEAIDKINDIFPMNKI